MGWGGGSWRRRGVVFGTGCYVRAFQTLETWYWPRFPEGVSKETLRLVRLLNTSLYCVRNKSSLFVWSQVFNQTACALSWALGNLLHLPAAPVPAPPACSHFLLLPPPGFGHLQLAPIHASGLLALNLSKCTPLGLAPGFQL